MNAMHAERLFWVGLPTLAAFRTLIVAKSHTNALDIPEAWLTI